MVQIDNKSGALENPKQSIDFDSWDKQSQNKLVELTSGIVRKDFLTMFGIFASLITFVSIQIQIFSKITNTYEMISVSSFSLGGLLLFAIVLHSLSNSNDWKDFKKPAFIISMSLCLLFLVIALILLLWNSGTTHDPILRRPAR